jgi:hypothetical protein
MIRRLKPWQRERMIREFFAERDQRMVPVKPAERQPAFAIGDRVRPRDRELCGTVRALAAWPRVTAYRVAWDRDEAVVELWLERELRRAL